ncbi:MAG: dihydroxyacetone kinase subunit L [Kiritimatiellae bacterium]|nr:dihydroxyacetone kinase subunit L [Kiritimatiellia bacterium]
MTIEAFKQAWAAAREAVAADEKRFSELDAATGGDGDHGTAIVAAMGAIAKADGADFKTLIAAMAEQLETEASGSTSTLYGSWLEGMAEAAPAAAEVNAAELAAMFEGGLEEIGFATRARVGGKTLMDALIPATEALAAAQAEGIPAMFAAAAAAAKKGAEATCGMKATFGRAKNLGDRSIGPMDPGAASMACVFGAFERAFKTL